jgi:hypothetical protein
MLGRGELLEALRQFWLTGKGVASLVGIGGAGKTTLLRRVMDELLDEHTVDGVLVWSFYDDPDTNEFLKTAVEYVGGNTSVQAQGGGWFHSLKQALDSDRQYLFILDGLERVQRPVTDAQGVFGELEDPLLRGLLVRLTSPSSNSKALITSRFPIADLERWNGKVHTVLAVDQLDLESAKRLLSFHGVVGTNEQITEICNFCGGHALTIDLMGSAVTRFFGGDASKVLPLKQPDARQGELQTARLGGVLRLFDDGLSREELDLMSRLCVFRFGVGIDSLESVFLKGKNGVAGSLGDLGSARLRELLDGLVSLHLVHLEGEDRFTVHPAVRDHFYSVFRDAAVIHQAIGEHLSTLTHRPGVGLPVTKEALDLLEELVYHALQSGDEASAQEIFSYRMGGGDHLNITLGEYARTYRILSAFPKSPEAGAMYFCLRAFGRFEEALDWRPQNRYIRILNGQLRALRDDPDENTRKIARLLRGEAVAIPERAPDHPLCPAHLMLLVDQVDAAEANAKLEIAISLHQDDIVRNRLVLAEAMRRKGMAREASDELDAISAWVIRSGSNEHLATSFLFRARQEMDAERMNEAKTSLEEALEITVESGFRILEIECRVEWSRWLVRSGEAAAGLEQANLAAQIASDPNTEYVWGQARAIGAKIDALRKLGRTTEQAAEMRLLVDLLKKLDSQDWRAVERSLQQLQPA